VFPTAVDLLGAPLVTVPLVPGNRWLPLARTGRTVFGGHVISGPGALVDCGSEPVAERSGSDGQVAR
jgi:hypothetical protein